MERDRTPAPAGATYSDAVAIDLPGCRWIYVAGQTARATGPDQAPSDVAGQTELCLRQIESLLAEWDATLDDLVQVTVYLTDLGDYASYAAVRARMLSNAPPASAAVGVASLLGDAVVEIAAVAVTERPA